jgi:hypothetical protein
MQAASGRILQCHPSSVSLRDRLDDGQAQPATAFRSTGASVEPVECALALRRRNTRAAVNDFKSRPSGSAPT